MFLPYLTICLKYGVIHIRQILMVFCCYKKIIIRIMSGVKRLDNTNSMFQQLLVLQFLDIIQLNMLLFIYKAYHRC